MNAYRSERSSEAKTSTGSAAKYSTGGGVIDLDADDDPDKPPVITFDHMWYHCLKGDQRASLLADAHRATSLCFLKHNIPFWVINSMRKEYSAMIKAVQKCPVYKPVDRGTLSGAHLEARSAEADLF